MLAAGDSDPPAVLGANLLGRFLAMNGHLRRGGDAKANLTVDGTEHLHGDFVIADDNPLARSPGEYQHVLPLVVAALDGAIARSRRSFGAVG